MSIEITSESPDDTLAIGRRFATVLTAGDIVVLSGRLGAGKTLFVSGVADGLGITERITSPSFIIARTYRGGFLPLVHADAYRLGSMAEFYDLELSDVGREGVVIIEWGDAVAEGLPPDRITVRFDVDGDVRRITMEPMGSWCGRDLAAVLL